MTKQYVPRLLLEAFGSQLAAATVAAGAFLGPLVIGLVFAFGWEPAVLLFPGYLRRFTVAYYLQALVTHQMPQDSAVSMLMQVFHEVPTVAVSLLSLAVIIILSLWSAGRAVGPYSGGPAHRGRRGRLP